MPVSLIGCVLQSPAGGVGIIVPISQVRGQQEAALTCPCGMGKAAARPRAPRS